MYEKIKSHSLEQSASSLYNNLDILIEDDDIDDEQSSGHRRMSYLTVCKSQVNILHCHRNGMYKAVQVSYERNTQMNKSTVLQAKWCTLSSQDFLVIANYKGLLIFDVEGQLLMFWYTPENVESDENQLTFCRGIACVSKQYICVGTCSGKVLVITSQKNTFTISSTLENHTDPVSVLSGLQEKSTESEVDFVSAEDNGTICTYKSGDKFKLIANLWGSRVPCTSVQLLPNGLVVGGYLSGHIRVFDASTSSLLAEISAHVRAVSCLDVTLKHDKDSYLAISGSEDSFIRVWKISREDTITVRQEWCTSVRDTQLCGLRFCDPVGQAFVTSGYDCKEIMQFSRVY